MAKIQTAFFCKNCGAKSAKWVGKCNSCGEWNTLVEEVVAKDHKKSIPWKSEESGNQTPQPRSLDQINPLSDRRFVTNDPEFNRVLGGGIVPGSVILIGGEPGIGKSTLLLQIALQQSKKVLYISGEESQAQIKMRADRLEASNDNCFILTETQTAKIFQQIKALQPDIVIVDSIQTLQTAVIDSTPGSISQLRECAGEMNRYAKESQVPVFLIGHITKEGTIAGPKILEHMVDTVLQFEGDKHHLYRILRTTKNRFGSTSEIGIYEMLNSGLKPILNPSDILINHRDEPMPGIAIGSTLEGIRPMLIEVQALVSDAAYGTPQRSSNGYDTKRLNMLLAVLEKKCGYRMNTQDVFINIAGGLKIEDPGIDLSVIAAIISSYESKAIPLDTCFIGEIGLSGEVRSVARIEQRVSEALKLGYKNIIISGFHQALASKKSSNQTLIEVKTINDLIRSSFR